MFCSVACVTRACRLRSSILLAGLAGASWWPLPAFGLVVLPSVSITETATSNVDLVASDRRSDLITQVSPAVSLTMSRGPLQGSLAYSLNGVAYARESSLNGLSHSLAASGKWQIVDDRAGLDMSANAGRQAVSAFGTQSSNAVANRGNQAQVVSYSLAPYLSGRLLGDVTYRGRLSMSQSASDSAGGEGDARSLSGSFLLGGRLAGFDWGVDASRVVARSQERSRTTNDRIFGSMSHSPDVEVRLALRLGVEADDVRTGRSERSATWGASAVWAPSPRTTITADLDKRAFGRSHAFSLTHRTARTSWSFSDSRSLDVSGVSSRGIPSNFDFLSQQLSFITDANARDAAVRQLLDASNLDPAGRELSGGFLTSGPTVQRTQTTSMTYKGLRATFTVLAFQTWSSSALQSASRGDLANGNQVRQQGLSFSLTHRLSTDASVVVAYSQQRTAGTQTQAGNGLQTVTATWSSRLGTHSNVSLGVRRSVADSDINPYHESAVIGSIRMQF